MFERTSAQLAGNILKSFNYWEWTILLIGSVVSYALWYGVGRLIGLPNERDISALVLRDPPAYAVIAIAIAWPLIALLSTLIAGRVRAEAGVFCSAIGLLYLPSHGGDSRNALLLSNNNPSIYLLMTAELLLLGAVALLVVEGVHRLLGRAIAARPAAADSPFSAARELSEAVTDPDTLGDRLTALFGQALATLIFTMFLVQTPMKGQALVGVGVAALAAAILTHHLYQVRGAGWYVAGTILAGIAGYLYNYFSPSGLAIGDAKGLFAGPARVLPLHYATLGVAGAIFGYWTSVVWKIAAQRKGEETTAASTT